MSVELKHPTIDGNVVHVPGPQVKRWTAAGWIKVGKSDGAPTDPEQNAPRSTAPLAEQQESDDS